ncbi:SRPBCC family protein [Pendulispora brunnea]|uniref:SRPBCC family protein n=1 Tax=Pendulispora brunnea TaxID=2905690 RepID=A0ABZ2JW83_9BACT
MLTACIVLAIMGAVGAFDIAYFHTYKAQLGKRPESRLEAWVHVVRGFVYAAQFGIVPNVRLGGAYYFALVALFVLDVAVAAFDVAIEPASRRPQGGLPDGEYAAHIFLSVLAGVVLHAVFTASAAWRTLPTAAVLEPHAPAALRVVLGLMAAGSLTVAVVELLTLLEASLPKPRPIHVSVRLRASAQAVWDITQDHVEHPNWDHRFSRIIMLSDTIRTGTYMVYEKTICGITIRGWGRYKLHRPIKQSTFEFGSDDVRSLIRRGVGLWLYRPRPGGLLEFSTAYTYDVRWGLFGRLVDRFVFRPFFQRETERSFRRLAARHFPESA